MGTALGPPVGTRFPLPQVSQAAVQAGALAWSRPSQVLCIGINAAPEYIRGCKDERVPAGPFFAPSAFAIISVSRLPPTAKV